MRPDEEIIKEIKSVLDKNVKHAVGMHGGMINFYHIKMVWSLYKWLELVLVVL